MTCKRCGGGIIGDRYYNSGVWGGPVHLENFCDQENGFTKPEPAPTPSEHPAAWDLVLADIRDRDAMGERKYKTRLQPFNGRDALVDAYQEALDLVVYLRQAIYEREQSGIEKSGRAKR